MIKTIIDHKVFDVVSGGGWCECWLTDTKIAFDRMRSNYSIGTEEECRNSCCTRSGRLSDVYYVESYMFDKVSRVCGEESPDPIYETALKIAIAWGLTDKSGW